MTDREMLQFAAKAAGIVIAWTDDVWGRPEAPPYMHLPGGKLWNPRDDDGDALRLFYTLPWMCIETSDVGVTVRERGNPDEPSRVYLMWTEWLDEHNGDLAPATRLAITRAAAEIGKAMQNA